MEQETFTWFAAVDSGSEKHQGCVLDARGGIAESASSLIAALVWRSCASCYDVAYVAKAKTPDPGFSTVATVRTVAIGEKGTGSYRFALNLRRPRRYCFEVRALS